MDQQPQIASPSTTRSINRRCEIGSSSGVFSDLRNARLTPATAARGRHPAACPLWLLPACLCWLLLTVPVGCQSVRERTDALKESSADLLSLHKSRSAKDAERPAKMVAIWSESVIYGPGKQPTRGLGGRVYLYNRNHQAVKADGELIVYAYDDGKDVDAEENVKPDRKYVFGQKQLAKHYSPSEFGPSYSVWIPWDEVGNATQPISVVPVFKDGDGQVVVGDHSRTLLPGKSPPAAELARRHQKTERMLAQRAQDKHSEVQRRVDESSENGTSLLDEATADNDVRRVSYEQRSIPTHPPGSARDRPSGSDARMTSTSIFVPESMKQRLIQRRDAAIRAGRLSDPRTGARRLPGDTEVNQQREHSRPAFRLRAVKAMPTDSIQRVHDASVKSDKDLTDSRSLFDPKRVVQRGSTKAIASRPSAAWAAGRTVGRQPFRPRAPVAQWPQPTLAEIQTPPFPATSPYDRRSELATTSAASSELGSNVFVD